VLHPALNPLREALGAASQPVTFFFRDDDAGWSNEHLYRLLDLFVAHATPIDLAVIPQACTADLAAHLLARKERNPKWLGFHQHGFGHINHETTGRKCEFGPSRSRVEQFDDLAQGQARLRALLGEALDPIFTPPWNRCSQATVQALAVLGFRVLSRDISASRLDMGDLRESRVVLDWCKRREGEVSHAREVYGRVGRAAASGRPVGIMLHHAVMEERDLSRLENLLSLLSCHRAARCVLMRDIPEDVVSPAPRMEIRQP
jgi:predicted deacetylase